MIRKYKRGQQSMSMPFGMIFSLFLIVIFFLVAFFAIRAFLGWGESTELVDFYIDFQDAVDEARSSQSYSSDFQIRLPAKIEFVCFANLSKPAKGPQISKQAYDKIEHWDFYDSNIFLIPPEEAGDFEHKKIDHINISKITATKNPYCIPAGEKIKIKKDFYDKLVSIS